MKLLPLERLGAHESAAGKVDFGLFLPWVSSLDGNRLRVKVIHENDQFIQDIQPKSFELSHSADPEYGDYWSASITLDPASKLHPASAWGTPGRYVYRYCLHNPNIPEEIDWIIDPFAREFGIGKLSAFTLGYQPHTWDASEISWKTPPLDDLVFYELMINEFGGDIDAAIRRLDYLADLGVNCIEVMPVSNVSNTIDWGFLPIGYFGVDERFGKRKDFQRFIQAAHQHDIAVILDVVYGHASESFPYYYVYKKLAYQENPFMGSFAENYFGESTDFNRPFTRDFFFTVNHHWLDCYHVDGFRYDCVPNYWDGPVGQGYAGLVYETYQMMKTKQGDGHWDRFFLNGKMNLIQCAEQLEGPREILEKTYSNCTWQNETLGAAQGVTAGNQDNLADLGMRLGLLGYPEEIENSGDSIRKTALQYIENHDHARFICNFKTYYKDNNDLLGEGDRSLWYKVQPYIIGLFTAKGIPLLWQGQEFGENYHVPDQGWGRVMLFRPVRWDYFYDPVGKAMIRLVRKLIKVRRSRPQFRYGDHFFYNDHERYQSKNTMLFHRSEGAAFSLIALNFSDHDQWIPFTFPFSGNYMEELHGTDDDALNLKNVAGGIEAWLLIPSNYGRVWTLESGL